MIQEELEDVVQLQSLGLQYYATFGQVTKHSIYFAFHPLKKIADTTKIISRVDERVECPLVASNNWLIDAVFMLR